MSTILRALKKLEHDKASRKSGPAELDLEFLESTPPAPRRSPLKGLLVVGLLIACGSAATYLFMARGEKIHPPAAQVAPPARQVVLQPLSSARPPVAPLINRSSVIAPAPVPVTPLQADHKPTPPPAPAAPSPTATKTQPDVAPAAKQRTPQAPKAPKAQVQTTPLLSLTVNGIALSDGEKRKAIVNGMSVSVGSVIGGARVEEILGNRVRFSHGGNTFEISVGNTGP